MRYLFAPQLNDSNRIIYKFDGMKIIASLNGIVDEFDFTGLPDGEAGEIVTDLPINPIVSAEIVDGVLQVVLLNFIGIDASEEEKFPVWKEVVRSGTNTVEQQS